MSAPPGPGSRSGSTSGSTSGSGFASGAGPRYYVGPFGRMFLTTDGPSSEQQSELPANLQENGNPPYQLPPPRVPTSLQFGSDPFSRHQDSPQADSVLHQRPEQLPSVSQILTPVSNSISPQYSQPFAALAPNTGRRGSVYPPPHNDPTFQVSPGAVHDRGRSESLPQPHNTGLPPLSQVALHGHGGMRNHTPTRSDPSAATFPHGQLPFHTASSHEQVPSGDLPSPESSSRPQHLPIRPHVVDERVIDGELCFVYADGSFCPKFIDGTPVNANWGVTKAGRPRKRLGLACLTCREKKIKCNPNPNPEAVCDQCRKSGRECRFESA